MSGKQAQQHRFLDILNQRGEVENFIDGNLARRGFKAGSQITVSILRLRINP